MRIVPKKIKVKIELAFDGCMEDELSKEAKEFCKSGEKVTNRWREAIEYLTDMYGYFEEEIERTGSDDQISMDLIWNHPPYVYYSFEVENSLDAPRIIRWCSSMDYFEMQIDNETVCIESAKVSPDYMIGFIQGLETAGFMKIENKDK